MKNIRRIDCEQLESRRYLSLAATVTEGDLIVTGDANGTVEIRAVEEGKFEILDNGEVVTTVEGITDDIRVSLDSDGTATDDHLILNLDTQTVDEVFIQLGQGNNTFELQGGVVQGSLRYLGGSGDDTVSISESSLIEGRVIAQVKSGDNEVQILGEVGQQLIVFAGGGSDIVEIVEGSLIHDDAYLLLGGGENLVTLSGELDDDVLVAGGNDLDLITVTDTAFIGGDLNVSAGDGDNVFELSGMVMGRVQYNGGSGDDLVTIGSTAFVADDVAIRLGEGSNTVEHQGDIAGDLFVTSANEEDTVTVDPDATVGGTTTLTLGEQHIPWQRRPLRPTGKGASLKGR